MSVALITALMFGALVLLLFSGLPICFSLGGVAMLSILALWGPEALYTIATSTWGIMDNFVLVAVPLFFFMGYVLQTSGLAEDLYAMMYAWFGPVSGGLAMGTVGICAIFAAMAGISGAATVSMGLIALPAMLKRDYNADLAVGSIAAGGALGIVIPPSIIMIIYCTVAPLSVSKYFAAGLFPGVLLAGLFILYIAIRCAKNKKLGPPLPPGERPSWRGKLKLLRAVILPIIIILLVLGSIWTGVATPTEAAGVGAFATLIAAAIHRRLTWKNLQVALGGSVRLIAMALWILIAGFCFRSVYAASGASDLVVQILAAPANPYIAIIMVQALLIVLGLFLDPLAIIMLTVPMFWPVMEILGVNQLWFAALFVMNLNLAYITPPVGFNLFFLGGIVPPEIGMGDIYRSVIPFVFLNLLGITLVILFPQIALWLPSILYG